MTPDIFQFSSPDTVSEPPDIQHLGAPEHWRNEVLDVGRAFHQLIHDLVPRVDDHHGFRINEDDDSESKNVQQRMMNQKYDVQKYSTV